MKPVRTTATADRACDYMLSLHIAHGYVSVATLNMFLSHISVVTNISALQCKGAYFLANYDKLLYFCQIDGCDISPNPKWGLISARDLFHESENIKCIKSTRRMQTSTKVNAIMIRILTCT